MKKDNQKSIKSLEKEVKRKKYIKIFMAGLGILSLFFVGMVAYSPLHIMHAEQNRSATIIQKKRSVLFFYRDTCPACHKIFPQVLAAKDGGVPVQMINTLNKSNRKKYLSKYHIESVPTFIILDDYGNETDRYVGNDSHTIQKILEGIM